MNWEFGIKPNIEGMLNMIHVCLENKITTFDHADMVLTPLAVSESICFSKIARKIQLSKCGIKCWLKIEITKSNITTTLSHIIWSVEQSLKNLKTDYLDVFLLQTKSIMQSDEIAEAVEKLKSEGK
jgi:predicted oxidoreductase